jgi:hypothetical protein
VKPWPPLAPRPWVRLQKPAWFSPKTATDVKREDANGFFAHLDGGLLPLDVYELAQNRATAGHGAADVVGHGAEGVFVRGDDGQVLEEETDVILDSKEDEQITVGQDEWIQEAYGVGYSRG